MMTLSAGSYLEDLYCGRSDLPETAGNGNGHLVELTVDELVSLHDKVCAGDKFESEVSVDADYLVGGSGRSLDEL